LYLKFILLSIILPSQTLSFKKVPRGQAQEGKELVSTEQTRQLSEESQREHKEFEQILGLQLFYPSPSSEYPSRQSHPGATLFAPKQVTQFDEEYWQVSHSEEHWKQS
jgi:hypothetical protein